MSTHSPFVHILAISGSLRPASANTSLLRAAVELVPANVIVTLYDGLDSLPHFSSERDTDSPPNAVNNLRAQLRDGAFLKKRKPHQ